MNNLKWLLALLILLPATLQAQSNIEKANSLSQLIAQFSDASKRALPYGSDHFTYDFPEYWENDVYKGVQTHHDTVMNKLDAFSFFEDYTNRLTAEVPYNIARQLVDTSFIAFPDSVMMQGKGLELKVTEISSMSDKFRVFSIIYQGYDEKYGCEYPLSQSHNLLITVDSANRITDKLLIAFADVSLDGEVRYCYINSKGTIYLKDFALGELSVYFLGSQQYRISQQGKLVKVDREWKKLQI